LVLLGYGAPSRARRNRAVSGPAQAEAFIT